MLGTWFIVIRKQKTSQCEKLFHSIAFGYLVCFIFRDESFSFYFSW